MSKHLFIIHDNGTKWDITGTRLEMNDSFVVDPLLYFETDKEDFFLFVKGLLDDSNEVSYLKGVTPTEVADLTVSPLDYLSVYKARTRTKGTHILKQYCDFTLQFDFFQFSVLNNKMIDAGYVITDENREAKYLDVINTGDEALIADLDVYLELRDRIAVSTHNYNNYIQFKNIVNDATTASEVDTAYADFAAIYG